MRAGGTGNPLEAIQGRGRGKKKKKTDLLPPDHSDRITGRGEKALLWEGCPNGVSSQSSGVFSFLRGPLCYSQIYLNAFPSTKCPETVLESAKVREAVLSYLCLSKAECFLANSLRLNGLSWVVRLMTSCLAFIHSHSHLCRDKTDG